jgi:hypothetical protein
LFFGLESSTPLTVGANETRPPSGNQTPTEPPRPAPRSDLTEIQRRILSAAQDGGTIYVYRLPGPQEGEVKSGRERFFGDEAVAAVATMIAPGLLTATGEDRFELTSAGLRLASSLT